MNKTQERIETVEKGMLAKGQKELLAHLYEEKLTLKQAILAKCYDCMCYFEDGKQDCKVTSCPIYPFMPYNPGKRKTRTMSDENKKAAGERLKNARIQSSVKQNSATSTRKAKGVSQ